eukprot:scaffold3.g6704.t1
MAVQPASWWIGPPPPRAATWLTRALQAAVLAVMFYWVFGYLGGLAFSPTATEGGNDTSGIFNWHPILMTLAFPVLMGEALLAYRAPLAVTNPRDRQLCKMWHFGLQTAAVVLCEFGAVAAFQSHNRKRPDPIPNLYSAHSLLGVTVLALLGLQFAVGTFSYLWPKLSLSRRRALGPLHAFLGKSVFVLGLAAMAVGIQEKTTFVQLGQKPALFSPAMRLPAVLQLLLAFTGMAVLFHHAPPAPRVKGGATTESEAEAQLVDQERLLAHGL